MRISVVVNSFNEGDKLDQCLKSVKNWADEIVVINMQSTDNTVEVARRFGAKIINLKNVGYIEPSRELAVSKTSGEWIMVLDPDEKVGQELKNKLNEVARDNVYSAVNIPRLNFIAGKKIHHTNFWPDRHIRFFKRGKVVFSPLIHSYPKVLGKVLALSAKENLAIVHYSYKSFAEYWQRMKRYSTIEAKNLFDNGYRFSIINLFYKPLYDFLRRYIRHCGFLDGFHGLFLSLMQAYYYIMVEYKLLKLIFSK